LPGAPSRGLDLVRYAGGRLESSRGAVWAGALADAAGVSGNHLAAQFKSHVGVTPKRVARIYRFARLILSVDALRPVGWPGLAQTAGYFDQARFSREFKDFTGHTPTGYLALRRRFPRGAGVPAGQRSDACWPASLNIHVVSANAARHGLPCSACGFRPVRGFT
jgi:AraC-like DNA-binding protein